jgi:hypothetical protein
MGHLQLKHRQWLGRLLNNEKRCHRTRSPELVHTTNKTRRAHSLVDSADRSRCPRAGRYLVPKLSSAIPAHCFFSTGVALGTGQSPFDHSPLGIHRATEFYSSQTRALFDIVRICNVWRGVLWFAGSSQSISSKTNCPRSQRSEVGSPREHDKNRQGSGGYQDAADD